MILRKLSNAFRQQDWMTVAVEFLLVLGGVLIALQVDRYNDEQKHRAAEMALLTALTQSIERDITTIQSRTDNYGIVERYAQRAIEILDGENCVDGECWPQLVSIFHATQWLDIRLDDSTFEEMKRAGLPTNPDLKEQLQQYYYLGRSRSSLASTLPEYRELARSIIPADMQAQMWSQCFGLVGVEEAYTTDCEPAGSEDAIREVIESLRQSPRVKQTLTFWMSNIRLTIVTYPQQIDLANELLVAIRDTINDMR